MLNLPWESTIRRVAMTLAYTAFRLLTRISGKRGAGVKALVVTPDRRIVLVRHSYMPGWHFPGGGMKRRETAEQAILRELSEEIGLVRWSGISQSDEPLDRADPNCTGPALFILTGAEYRFRPNLEIEAAEEFDADALPPNCPRSVRRNVAWWHASQP